MHHLFRSRAVRGPREPQHPAPGLLWPLASGTVSARKWTVDSFHGPSIGLEYREDAFSYHSEYYTTIPRAPGSDPSEAVGCTRLGLAMPPAARGFRPGVHPTQGPRAGRPW